MSRYHKSKIVLSRSTVCRPKLIISTGSVDVFPHCKIKVPVANKSIFRLVENVPMLGCSHIFKVFVNKTHYKFEVSLLTINVPINAYWY